MAEGLGAIRGNNGEYHLQERIGEGGFAVVYRARSSGSTSVAVKVLKDDSLLSVSRERFRQEVAALGRLSHPNIVPLLDSGEWNGRPFLVMPWIEGPDLAEMLKKQGPLTAERVLEMSRAIGGALGHAHDAGTVHRDITPSNILWSGERWWLVDFGLALDAEVDEDERVTSTGTVVGTSAYMSPEQVAGGRAIDGRSDQYSLACVMYEVLAGVPPFVAASAQATRAMRLHTAAPDIQLHRPGLPAGLCTALTRALSREPADRYPSTRAFVAALDERGKRGNHWGGTVRTRRYALRVALGVAALGGLYYAMSGPEAADPLAAGSPDPRHVAVMYFEDQSPDSSLGWLARALTRDLIHDLSSLDTLRVVTAAGVAPYRAGSASVDSIARVLNVGVLVDGTVRAFDREIEVTVQMIDATDGFKISSRRIVRPSGSIFSLQRELLFGVSGFLRERIGHAALAKVQRSRVGSLEAWTLAQLGQDVMEEGYSLGRRGYSTRAWSALERADSLFARANQLEPSWLDPVLLRARVERGRFLALTLSDPVAGQEPGSAGMKRVAHPRLTQGLGHAMRALALSPDSPEAQTLEAYFLYTRWWVDNEQPGRPEVLEAEQKLRGVVSRHPEQALAWTILARIYTFRGDTTAADDAVRRALDADPFLWEGRRRILRQIEQHIERGRIAEGARLCAASRAAYQDDVELLECRLLVLAWTANHSDSVEAAWRDLRWVESLRMPSLDIRRTVRHMYVAAVAARAGLVDSADAIVRRTYAEFGRHPPDSTAAALAEAWVQVLAGRRERARTMVDSMVRHDPGLRGRISASPWFRTLRNSPVGSGR